MAHTTSSDFSVTRDEIIKAALRLLGVIDPDETPDATRVTNAAEALNMMCKSWIADGLHQWTVGEGLLILQNETEAYALGSSSGDHFSDEMWFQELDSAASDGDTTITVDSATYIDVNDNIGIRCDDNTVHWTTVTGISGTTITLNAALIAEATDGSPVYIHTDYASRPLKVYSARLVLDGFEGTEIVLRELSEEGYKSLSNKYTEGQPTAFWYDPRVTGYGYIYLWPRPDSTKDFLKISYQFPIYDFDAANDNPHFPIEWAETLKYNLAVRLAPEYSVSVDNRLWLKREAEELLTKLLAWDRNHAPIYFQPDIRRR